MIIRLKNFCCYEDRVFDFGEDGLSLLSGPSGIGKTSILKAIYFALFGTGTKIISFGSTSCSVELEFGDLKILRTKRPNRLLVNDIHEDQCGQDIINRIFGNTFDVTGYISQNAINSFILMSPMEKLEFLEKFAFKDVDLGKIKGRCKVKINELNEAMLRSISQLELATNVFNELTLPSNIPFPINCKNKNEERVIKNEEIKYKNCNILIKRSRNSIKETQKELTDTLVLQASLSSKQEELSYLETNINEISFEESNIAFEGSKKLEEYKTRLSALKSRRELIFRQDILKDDLSKLEEMKEVENTEKLKQLQELTSSMWVTYSKEELSVAIGEYKQFLVDAEKIVYLTSKIQECKINPKQLEVKKIELDKLRIDLDQKKKTLETLKIQKELYSCPCCNSRLRFINDKLHIADGMSTLDDSIDIETLKTEITSIITNMKKLESCIPYETDKLEKNNEYIKELAKIQNKYDEPLNLQTLKDDLEYLREYGASQNELEKQRNELQVSIENEKYSSSYISFKQNIIKQKSVIKELEMKSGDNDEVLSEKELSIIITQQEHNKNKIDSLSSRKRSLQQETEKYNKQIEELKSTFLQKYKQLRTENELKCILEEHENKIQEFEQNKEVHEQNLEKIKEYKKNKEEKENYFTWQEKVINLQNQEKEDRNRYAAATMLKDKILEAESLAMLNVINTINTHAQLYLDCFFTENPISVRLVTFKETKKNKKPQITIEIEYKGMECDLSMLSGGELSRVILAYTLALGEMFSTPLLLLDECTSNLDQDLSTSVFNSVRQHFTGKLVIIIAHQVVTGTFDRTIKLGIKE